MKTFPSAPGTEPSVLRAHLGEAGLLEQLEDGA